MSPTEAEAEAEAEAGVELDAEAATGLGLRERKKLRTRHELKAVALQLFVEHGFDAVTIDDIAAAADVSKSTFYRYFESKEDVLVGGKAEALGLLRDALARRPADEAPLEAARHAYLAVAPLFEYDRGQKLIVAQLSRTNPSLAARDREHQAAFEQLLRDDFSRRTLDQPATRQNPTPQNPTRQTPTGPASTLPPSTLHAWVLAAQVIGVMRAAVDFWIDTGGEQELPEIMDEALRGLIDTTSPAIAPSPQRSNPGQAHR